MAGREKIAANKRLQAFDATDFDLLIAVLNGSGGLAITPNAATETSNLLRFGRWDHALQASLRNLLERWDEHYLPSRDAARHPAYPRLGLSDAAMLSLITESDGLLLLTADVELYMTAQRDGLPSENFNHLRAARPDFT